MTKDQPFPRLAPAQTGDAKPGIVALLDSINHVALPGLRSLRAGARRRLTEGPVPGTAQ